MSFAARNPAQTPQSNLVSKSAPPFLKTYGVDLRSIVAPIQTMKTDMIDSEPVIHALVKEPSVFPSSGKRVFTAAPSSSGTSIIPPGIFSMVCLIRIGDQGHELRKSSANASPRSPIIHALTAARRNGDRLKNGVTMSRVGKARMDE